MALDLSKRLELLAITLLDEQAYKTLQGIPPHLYVLMDPFTKIWMSVLADFYGAWDKLPDLGYMGMLLEYRLSEESDESIKMEQFTIAKRTLATAKRLAAQDTPALMSRNANQILGEVLRELRSQELMAKLDTSSPDVSERLQEAQRDLSTIEGLNADRFPPFMAKGAKLDDPLFSPLGLEFIDNFLDGGALAGEVIGHLAPIGMGKTTMICQLLWGKAVSMINRVTKDMSLVTDEMLLSMPKVYAFMYEPVVNLKPNYFSNAASISRESVMDYFKSGSDESLLSTKEKQNYKPYEERLPGFAKTLEAAKKGEVPFPNGELERIQSLERPTNGLLRVADFAGGEPMLEHWRTQGVRGMAAYIEAHQSACGNPGVALVCCDYVGAMVDVSERYASGKIPSRDHAIRGLPGEMTELLANKFHCPVWAAHQLNPGENTAPAGSIPNALKGEGSKMFAERCANSFATGRLTDEGVGVLVQGKRRRGDAKPPITCRLEKLFARWSVEPGYTISDGYVIDKRMLAEEGARKVDSSFIEKRFE